MRISVVVVTFNGAPYVEQQLRSILRQTRPADQILVFDDDSSDNTSLIAAESLGTSGMFTRNPERKGLLRNIEHALRVADGDIVVLADQDDVWKPDKLRVIEQRFAASPSLDLLFSDADLIDGEGMALPGHLWDTIGFNQRQQRLWARDPMKVVLCRTVVTGAACALSRSLVSRSLPLPATGIHDAWFALVAALHQSRTLAEPMPLIAYRLHDTNTQGLPSRSIWGRLGAMRWPAPWLLDHWRLALARYPDAPEVHRLRQAARFHEARMALPSGVSRFVSMGGAPLGPTYLTAAGGRRALAWDLLGPRLFPAQFDADRVISSLSQR